MYNDNVFATLNHDEMMSVEGGVCPFLPYVIGYMGGKFVDDIISGKKYNEKKGSSPSSMRK